MTYFVEHFAADENRFLNIRGIFLFSIAHYYRLLFFSYEISIESAFFCGRSGSFGKNGKNAHKYFALWISIKNPRCGKSAYRRAAVSALRGGLHQSALFPRGKGEKLRRRQIFAAARIEPETALCHAERGCGGIISIEAGIARQMPAQARKDKHIFHAFESARNASLLGLKRQDTQIQHIK